MDKETSDLATTIASLAHSVEETTEHHGGILRAARTLALLSSLRTDDAEALPGGAIAEAARDAADGLAAAHAGLLAIRADLLALLDRTEHHCAEGVA